MKRNFLKRITALAMVICLSVMMLFSFSGCIYRAYKRQYSRDLIAAIEANDMEELQRLVDQGGDLDYGPDSPLDVESFNLRPLIEAIDYGNFEAVKILVEGGAKINIKDESALVYSVSYWRIYGSFEIAYYLIEKGANVRETYGKATAIQYAASQGRRGKEKEQLDFLIYLLDLGAKLEDAPKGHIAFDACCNNENLHVVQYLFDNYEIDVNMRDKSSQKTMLMYTTSYLGAPETCQYLLEKGADKTLKDSNGKTAYDLAYEKYQDWLPHESQSPYMVESFRKLLELLED